MSGKNLDFPWYFAIENYLVKVIATPSGGMDVLTLNPATGKLERNMEYLVRCFEPGQDVQRISEAEFNTRSARLKTAIAGDPPS
jgi:hypothetical protein